MMTATIAEERAPLTDEERDEVLAARKALREILEDVGARRGSGRTTRQIEEAPRGALIVAATSSHARDTLCRIADQRGRRDLIISSWDNLGNFARGIKLGGVVIEHFAAEHLLAFGTATHDGLRKQLIAWRAYQRLLPQVRP